MVLEMVYTPTVWACHSMTTAQKLTALDNLETLYTQAVSYIDAITHSASYYTDAQAAARYFSSATDGTGSGMIAATWDGLTADQAFAAMGAAPGAIAIWSGAAAAIPTGWLLCNGGSGTPDLRDRFVVGAGGNYARGATGGANTVTTTASVTIAGHALTAAEIALHGHGSITDNYPGSPVASRAGVNMGTALVRSNTDTSRNTGATGSGSSHGHTASFAGTASQDKRPAYYALCYIMKS